MIGVGSHPSSRQLDAETLFAKYLDLTGLRGRDSGVVRCIFHEDDDPSLSVDIRRGLFHCFGCGAQGGLKAFAALVGEPVAESRRTLWLGDREEALREALARERAAQRRRDQYRAGMHAADDYRIVMAEVHDAWSVATKAGASDLVWDLLGMASFNAMRAEADLAEVVG